MWCPDSQVLDQVLDRVLDQIIDREATMWKVQFVGQPRDEQLRRSRRRCLPILDWHPVHGESLMTAVALSAYLGQAMLVVALDGKPTWDSRTCDRGEFDHLLNLAVLDGGHTPG